VRGFLRDAVCGRSPKASSLRLTRRHFLLQGDDFGAGDLHPVELLVRHAGQLFRREIHVLMQVLVLLGCREPQVLHEQLQRLELVCPACLDTRLLRERLEIGVGDGLAGHWWSQGPKTLCNLWGHLCFGGLPSSLLFEPVRADDGQAQVSGEDEKKLRVERVRNVMTNRHGDGERAVLFSEKMVDGWRVLIWVGATGGDARRHSTGRSRREVSEILARAQRPVQEGLFVEDH